MARLKAPTPKMLPVDSGRMGARRRWGPPRILRLDELDPVTREIVQCIFTARAGAPSIAEQLTVALSDNIRRLRAGELTPAQANAVTREANKVISTVEVALRAAKTAEDAKRAA
jgi:hypothetical protein